MLQDFTLEHGSPEVIAVAVRETGPDGPFRGTDASIRPGYRLHYCSWHYRGLWPSFRHIYIGK